MLKAWDDDGSRSCDLSTYCIRHLRTVVPYGDTAGDHYMNHSFDLGESIFGKQVNSLKLGCDCLGAFYRVPADSSEYRTTLEMCCIEREN